MGELASVVVHLIGVTITSFCFSRCASFYSPSIFQESQEWMTLIWYRTGLGLFYMSSWLFLFLSERLEPWLKQENHTDHTMRNRWHFFFWGQRHCVRDNLFRWERTLLNILYYKQIIGLFALCRKGKYCRSSYKPIGKGLAGLFRFGSFGEV